MHVALTLGKLIRREAADHRGEGGYLGFESFKALGTEGLSAVRVFGDDTAYSSWVRTLTQRPSSTSIAFSGESG